MTDTIEILFEDINFDKLSNYLDKIGEESDLINCQISVDNAQSKEKINKLSSLTENFDKYSEGSIYLTLEKFRVATFLLPKVGVHILKYDGSVDMSIDIDYSYFQILGSLKSIQTWSETISRELSAKNYCCGYEPASDEGTRFFTMDKLGPLSFKKENA